MQYCQNKSDIRFQYLVYYIINTCNINDNRVFKVKLLSISELYGILFNVKEIWVFGGMIKLKDPWLLEMHRYLPRNRVHVYFVSI